MPTAVYLEIAERIIDELADDERSLRNCALVCQGWVPRSRSYLFREVHITTLKQLYALCCVLRSTSTLRTVVRVVRIARPNPTHTATIDSSATSDHPAESTTHFLNESVLDSAVVALLSYLPNLLCWHLDALKGSLRGYLSVSARALAAFPQYAALQELRLSFLEFDSSYQLYKLLRGFPMVRVLRFEGHTYKQELACFGIVFKFIS
ncbi:hypothetical protein C8Q74DRAFT_561933 [Fomes fomentarius]|nr:hypothetical protein C8Q74DRAFT_561933 [Fomes fomentarius]